jgi:hypothetical protein
LMRKKVVLTMSRAWARAGVLLKGRQSQ